VAASFCVRGCDFIIFSFIQNIRNCTWYLLAFAALVVIVVFVILILASCRANEIVFFIAVSNNSFYRNETLIDYFFIFFVHLSRLL